MNEYKNYQIKIDNIKQYIKTEFPSNILLDNQMIPFLYNNFNLHKIGIENNDFKYLNCFLKATSSLYQLSYKKILSDEEYNLLYSEINFNNNILQKNMFKWRDLYLKKFRADFISKLYYDPLCQKYNFIKFIEYDKQSSIDLLIFLADYYNYDLYILSNTESTLHGMMEFSYIENRKSIVIYFDDYNISLIANENNYIFQPNHPFIIHLAEIFKKYF